MRISERTWKRGILAALAGALAAAEPAAAGPSFRSGEEALQEGISAYRDGFYELALPALEFATAENKLLARYYLARIYSDPASAHADHGKAYELYMRIADENADADPDDDRLAPYVGKSLTALAGYLRVGVPAIGVKPNPARAAEYLRYAASFFRDPDAQFELAKMQLKGEGLEVDPASAKHWLSVLSRNGHAGAQAVLAGLYWRGDHIEADPVRALALVSLAVMNAPARERLWIEDVYQSMFCATGASVRAQADETLTSWRKRYVRKTEDSDPPALVLLEPQPRRTCAGGEPVVLLTGDGSFAAKVPETAGSPAALPPGPAAAEVSAALPAEGLPDQGALRAPGGGANGEAVVRGVSAPASAAGP